MIQVRIREQYVSDCLDVYIINVRDGERRLLHMDDSVTFRWDDFGSPDHAVTDSVLEPTFVLPFDSGRALLDALTRHYHGADDTRALRRDYDAERKRVDEQAAVIADIARTLANRRETT
jgi:hypothetical protein